MNNIILLCIVNPSITWVVRVTLDNYYIIIYDIPICVHIYYINMTTQCVQIRNCGNIIIVPRHYRVVVNITIFDLLNTVYYAIKKKLYIWRRPNTEMMSIYTV